MPAHPPRAIAVSERLRLRWAELDDAELIAVAVAESLDHLGPWMSWATPDAALPDEQRTRRLEQQAATAAGTEYTYLLLSPDDELLGVCGVHRRIGPRAVEIGYWLHPRHLGRGYVTEAVSAIMGSVLALADVERVEIHCDEANLRSQAVPRRLGFRLDRIEDDGVQAPAETGRGMVWVYPPE